MSGNIEKILYIGFAVLLLGIAFAFFFSGYNNYRDYITVSSAILNEDKTVTSSEGKGKSGIRGSEVIHQVIDAKRMEMNSRMLDMYSDKIVSSHQNRAEIWVSWENAMGIEISDVEIASFYSVEFEKDYSGRIIKILYTLR